MTRPAARLGRAALALAFLAASSAQRPATAPAPGPSAAASPAPAGSSEVVLQLSADRPQATVGDPILLTARLSYPAGTSIRSFSPAGSLGELTLLDRAPGAPRDLPGGRKEEVIVLKVAAYRPGAVDLPPIDVIYVDRAGREGKTASPPLHLEITSVLKPGDTSPADIKPQAAMAERPVWPWVVLAALCVLAAIGLWLRRRKPEAVPALESKRAAPPRPAHEIAYAELERLLSSGLLEAGRLKELYIELAEIMRRYLGARFDVDTFEKTSTEILDALRAVRAPVKATAMASQFFASCDLVKFAKYRPGLEETRDTVQKAYALIDETRPAPPASAAGSPAGAAAAGGAA